MNSVKETVYKEAVLIDYCVEDLIYIWVKLVLFYTHDRSVFHDFFVIVGQMFLKRAPPLPGKCQGTHLLQTIKNKEASGIQNSHRVLAMLISSIH